MVVCTFRLGSLNCFPSVSAEMWSWNGKIPRTVSSVPVGGDKSCCWSQSFDSMELLMVQLTGCLGYFNVTIPSSNDHIHSKNVTKTKINNMLDQAFFVSIVNMTLMCTYTFFSICGERFSSLVLMCGGIPLHSVSVVNFTEECALLSVSRKVDAITIFGTMVSISST